MDGFSDDLNEVITDTYNTVMRVEAEALKKAGRVNLTINELHLIECVGKYGEDGCFVSDIAQQMAVKRPSATVAVNKLEDKGFLSKIPSENDGRMVRVVLTKEGKKINAYHSYYHRLMVREITGGLNEDEQKVLYSAVSKLNDFFKKSIT